MATDESMATKCEDWIVTQVRAITVDASAVFETADVKPYEGTQRNAAKNVGDELLGIGRDLIVRVLFVGHNRVPLAGDQSKRISRYVVMAAVKAGRDGASRRGGDVATYGTNALRDLIGEVLENGRPAISAGGWHTDEVRVESFEVVMARREATISQFAVMIDEVPVA